MFSALANARLATHLHFFRQLPSDFCRQAKNDRSDESAFNKIFVRAKGATGTALIRGHGAARGGADGHQPHRPLESMTISFNLAPVAPLGDASNKIEIQARL